MTSSDSLRLHALTEHNLAPAAPDLLRAMVKSFTDAQPCRGSLDELRCGGARGPPLGRRGTRSKLSGQRSWTGSHDAGAVL